MTPAETRDKALALLAEVAERVERMERKLFGHYVRCPLDVLGKRCLRCEGHEAECYPEVTDDGS